MLIMAKAATDPIPGVTDADCLELVGEYCALATQPRLSPQDSDRLEQLLTLAEQDGRLDFWINEADHFIDHALGLGSATRIYASVNENLKARLREMLDLTGEAGGAHEEEAWVLLTELQDSLAVGTREMQQALARHGFDPGDIDGVAGPKTHRALKDFQQRHAVGGNAV
jgi:hypothetical protein